MVIMIDHCMPVTVIEKYLGIFTIAMDRASDLLKNYMVDASN